jgi:cardiolipin synthase A/B
LTPEDLEVTVKMARTLPPHDIDRLVEAAGRGLPGLFALRAESTGVVREACQSLIQISDRISTAEIGGVLQGAARVYRLSRNRVDLVWTGPDVPGSISRLTSAAVAELVDQARKEVLVISYAIYAEPMLTAALTRAVNRGVFVQALYERSADNPLFHGNQAPFPGLNIRRLCWPAYRRPAGASMHAKALVIDREVVLIGSANISGPAMLRNIECGVLLRDPIIAAELVESIQSLVIQGVLEECGV